MFAVLFAAALAVVNSADYTAAIAPGGLISIFGQGFDPAPAGTTVEVNGIAAEVSYVGPGQINARMPFVLPGEATLQVRTPAGVNGETPVTVLATAPRFFPGLVFHADWTPVSAAAPAAAGEVLISFLTGLGPDAGVAAAWGGRPAHVLYAGPAPGFPGLDQLNFRVPAGAAGPLTVRAYPASTRLTFALKSRVEHHYDITVIEGTFDLVTAHSQSQSPLVTLTGPKAATTYTVIVFACADVQCKQRSLAGTFQATTPPEYWQMQGTGNTTAGLDRIVSDGNARISATRFGPEAGPVTANRVQLYYGPGGLRRQILSTALTQAPVDPADPSTYLHFESSGGTTGLLTPNPPANLIETIATGQGVPLVEGKVRIFFEAQGTDRKTRIFSIDSVDGLTGQDFNTGPATTCATAEDFSPGGGCPLRTEIELAANSARQNKVGYPILTDWRWDGAPGTFLVFTTDRVNGCTPSDRNHGYAVWDGSKWEVQTQANGCPKLFQNAQAAFPMHLGGVRYKLYYGDTSNTTGRLPGNLPFLGPKTLIYADGALTGKPDRVDFEDWEPQSAGRDVVFLWPNGDKLNDTAEGYIDDYHFLAPTGSLDLQVMFLVITNGTEIPFGAAAVLLNP